MVVVVVVVVVFFTLTECSLPLPLSLSLSLSLSLTGLKIFVIGEVPSLLAARIHMLLPNFPLIANPVLLEEIKN